MVEAHALPIGEVKLIGDQTFGDVLGKIRVALDRRQITRAAAFVRRRELLANAECKRGIMREEGGHVIIVDVQDHIGLFACKPLLHGLETLEDRRPDRVVLLVRILGERNGGRVGDSEPAENLCHDTSPSSLRAIGLAAAGTMCVA